MADNRHIKTTFIGVDRSHSAFNEEIIFFSLASIHLCITCPYDFIALSKPKIETTIDKEPGVLL